MLDIEELRAIKPGDRIQLSQTVSRLRKGWCPFVKRIGKCDELCSANPFCVSNIQEILDIRAPRSYYAVLTYRIRRQRALLAEGLEAEKLTIDKFGAAEDFSWEALKESGGKADHRPANLVAAPAVRVGARRSHPEEPTPARPAENDPKVAAGAPAG